MRRDDSFFFGPPEAQRYGSIRRAASSDDAVLVLSPPGPAYMSAHRAIGALIDDLVGRGRCVFRFDPFAHGDSHGSARKALPKDWEKDLELAFDECERRLAEARSVVAFGLNAAIFFNDHRRRERLSQCVIFDPNLSGKNFITDLERRQKEIEATTSAKWSGRADADDHDLLGFDFSAECRQKIAEYAISPTPFSAPTLAISTHALPIDSGEEALLKRIAPKSEIVHFPPAEGLVDDPFRPRVPQSALRRVAEFLSGARG